MTRQAVLEYDRQEKEAEARQRAEVAKIDADATRDAQVKAIEAQRGIDLASVQKQRELEVAERQQQQAVEVAEREKQENIALAEKRRAAAERDLAEAEAERERARQNVESVKCTEEAERAKRRQVIEAQAQAETKYVASQRQADAEAYTKQKQAEAARLAAHAEAEALRQKATAEAEAERRRAEGRTAIDMVPVEVQRAQVEVDRDRLETVVKPELVAREAHGKVAQDFEIRKLAVQAEKEVRVATAQATASVFTRMEAKLFGTPDEVNKLLSSLLTGEGLATTANAFMESADEQTRHAVDGIAAGLSGLASAAGQRLGSAAESRVDPSLPETSTVEDVPLAAIANADAESHPSEAVVIE